MHKFKVRNYRGISSADITLDKLAMICGSNDSGKTSTLEAIMCVATGQPNPFKEIKTKEISMLVHSGTPSGLAEIQDDSGTGIVKWPALEYTTKKEPKLISNIAAGIDSLIDMKIPDRINYIIGMMDALPKKSDLERELIKCELIPEKSPITGPNPLLEKMWEMIELNGWDNAHKQAREKGTKLKGVWEDTTGSKKYGKRIAEVWIPEAYDAELETIGEAKLIQAVVDAQEWRDAAIKQTSIADHDLERFQESVDKIPEYEKNLIALETDIGDCDKNIQEFQRKLNDCNQATPKTLECPECHQSLELILGELRISDATQKPKHDTTDIENHLNGWKNQRNQLFQKVGKVEADIKFGNDCKAKIAEIQAQDKTDTEGTLGEVENKLEHAETRLEAYQSYIKAHKSHKNILINEKLCKVLEPKGLRNKKLTKAYTTINNSLKVLTDAVKWKSVEINEDCDILYNGITHGRLIAKSGRYRTRVLLQIMVATAEKAKFMIVDDLDELVENVRSDMIRVILKSKISAVMVAAMDKKEKVLEMSSKLKKLGGSCYWVEKMSCCDVENSKLEVV